MPRSTCLGWRYIPHHTKVTDYDVSGISSFSGDFILPPRHRRTAEPIGSMLRMTENPRFFENGGYLATFDDRFLKKSIENYPKKYVSTPDATTRSCHSLVRDIRGETSLFGTSPEVRTRWTVQYVGILGSEKSSRKEYRERFLRG